MNKIEIRQLTINDLDQLQKISRKTFFETFNSSNTEENMQRYLDEEFSMGKISKELDDKNTAFYFAELDKKVIGYLKVNFNESQTEFQEDRAFEIERFYVLNEFHGKKIGQILYEKSVEIAQQKKVDYAWLGVWEHNSRAINFYKKNGFVEFDKHIFKLGDDEQIDIIMKLNFKNNK